MSIQVSVLIWTMINFFVLMLLLDRLLFQPLLRFMDARREKIDNAREAKAAAVKTGRWQQAATDLALMVDYYQDKAGKPDYFHMTGAAAKCGFAEITDDNLNAVIGALGDYATANQQPSA